MRSFRRLAISVCFAALAASADARKPTVLWSTYLGVADCDGLALWRDDAFLACHSPEIRLPVAVPGPDARPGVMGAYVLRVDLNRKDVVFATRLQGLASTSALRIKVDANGSAFVTGLTKGAGFPVTDDAVQPEFAGGESDAFVVRLSPQGRIVYGSYLGGSGNDIGNALELDGTRVVFVGGTTTSDDFPGRRGHRGVGPDAFVSRLRLSSEESPASIGFGGSAEEKLTGLAADGGGGLFAVGYTRSVDFPIHDPMQSELRGESDLFVVRFGSSDLLFTFSTYPGGTGEDEGWGVAVDLEGAPVVAGTTNSRDLPASFDALQRGLGGGLEEFVARLDKAGYGLARLTYFGGLLDDSSGYDGEDIKVDPHGNIWLAGLTSSRDLPVLDSTLGRYGGGATDGFIVAFSHSLADLNYGVFRGGSGPDLMEGLAVSSDGTVVVTGLTFSMDVPMPGRAMYRTPFDIRVDGRVAKRADHCSSSSPTLKLARRA